MEANTPILLHISCRYECTVLHVHVYIMQHQTSSCMFATISYVSCLIAAVFPCCSLVWTSNKYTRTNKKAMKALQDNNRKLIYGLINSSGQNLSEVLRGHFLKINFRHNDHFLASTATVQLHIYEYRLTMQCNYIIIILCGQ